MENAICWEEDARERETNTTVLEVLCPAHYVELAAIANNGGGRMVEIEEVQKRDGTSSVSTPNSEAKVLSLTRGL